MTTPTLLTDTFVGICLAGSIISAMFLVFLARRYQEREIRASLFWLAISIIPSSVSTVMVWFVERNFATSESIGWVIGVCVGLNLVLILLQWRRLRKLHHHVHLTKLIHALPWVLVFGFIAFGLQVADLIINGGPLSMDLVRGVAGFASIMALSFGAIRARAKYPGSGFEALGVFCGLGLIIVTVILIATTNIRVERAVINNQSVLVAHLIERQATQHLTKDAFDPQLTTGKRELAQFIDEVTLPELHRIKVIRADGLVLTSDLDKLTGTKIPLTGTLGEAMKGQESIEFVESPADLPETEQQFGSLRVLTVPLTVSSNATVLGAAQLYFDAPAALASIQALQNAINFAGIILITALLTILVFLLIIFQRTVSHPFADILDEVRHIHVETDSGEHRRIKVHEQSDFTVIADAFNILINEYEEKIRELKKQLHDKGSEE